MICVNSRHLGSNKLPLTSRRTIMEWYLTVYIAILKPTRKPFLKTHIARKHEGRLRFSCDKCEYRTDRGDMFSVHKQALHDGFKFECNECDYKATSMQRWKLHMQRIHKGRLRFSCDNCDQGAGQMQLVLAI